jgi:hypothetical protein
MNRITALPSQEENDRTIRDSSGNDDRTIASQGSQRALLVISIGSCMTLFYAAFWAILAGSNLHISDEHELMENSQAWCLLIGSSIFGFLALRSQRRDCRQLFGALALLYASFFLREVEVEDLKIPDVLILLGSGTGKRILLLTCWGVALLFFLKHARQTWNLFKRWIRSLAGICILVGGVCYFIGLPFDKNAFGIEPGLNLFLEEIAESIATIWMLISAILSLLLFRRQLKIPE